jgi:SPP1 family holin
MKVKKETIIRTAVAFVTTVNMLLTLFGKNPLPFSEDELYVGLSVIADVASKIWVWWKNNSFTPEAIVADSYKNSLKEAKKKGLAE